MILKVPLFCLHLLVGILLRERLCLFHMYVCVGVWTHELLFYSMGLNLLLSLFILMLTFPQFGQPLFPFDTSLSFFEHFITFWHNTFFQAYLILFFPILDLQSAIYSIISPFVWWRLVFRSQDLDSRCAHYY